MAKVGYDYLGMRVLTLDCITAIKSTAHQIDEQFGSRDIKVSTSQTNLVQDVIVLMRKMGYHHTKTDKISSIYEDQIFFQKNDSVVGKFKQFLSKFFNIEKRLNDIVMSRIG